MRTISGHTSKPKISLSDCKGHRNDYPGSCDFPIYRPTGAMITSFTDCSRSSEWPVKDERVMGGHRPVPSYCFQHYKMVQRLLELDNERRGK